MNNRPNTSNHNMKQEWMPKNYKEHHFSAEFEQKMQHLMKHSISHKDTNISESEKSIFVQSLLNMETKLDDELQHELDFLNREGTKKSVIDTYSDVEYADISDNIPPIFLFGKDYKKKILFMKFKVTTIALGFFLLLFNFFPYSALPIDFDYWNTYITNWFHNF